MNSGRDAGTRCNTRQIKMPEFVGDEDTQQRAGKRPTVQQAAGIAHEEIPRARHGLGIDLIRTRPQCGEDGHHQQAEREVEGRHRAFRCGLGLFPIRRPFIGTLSPVLFRRVTGKSLVLFWRKLLLIHKR